MTNEYKKLVKSILTSGNLQEGRNGNTLILPHYSFTLDFSTRENHILKLRKMHYKGVEGEFQTLINPTPLVNVSQFKANGCNYWDQWAEHNGYLNLDYHNMLHPQLEDVIRSINFDPLSRRHVIELWNHHNLENLSLPCCWHGMTFTVIENVLHMTWVQRSVDTMVGLPSDIYLAYRFMELVADNCDLQIGTCMFALSNVHIYAEHIDKAFELLGRDESNVSEPLSFEVKT